MIAKGQSAVQGSGQETRAQLKTDMMGGIEDDINASGRYQAVRARVLAMDRATQAVDIRRLTASPDVAMGSVAAVTEAGSLVIASASGSQLPGYAGGAARAIWIVGAQKVVPDLPAALHRVEEHCLPLESARAQVAYGQPSAVNRLLVLNAEYVPGRGTVLLPKGLWRKHTANGYTGTALVPDTLTDLGGGACFNDARVQVESAGLPTTVYGLPS